MKLLDGDSYTARLHQRFSMLYRYRIRPAREIVARAPINKLTHGTLEDIF